VNLSNVDAVSIKQNVLVFDLDEYWRLPADAAS